LTITVYPPRKKEETKPKLDHPRLTHYPPKKDFNIISGTPNVLGYQKKLTEMKQQRERAVKIQSKLGMSPVTHAYPSEAFDAARVEKKEELTHLRFECKANQMPPQLQRAYRSEFNTITGEGHGPRVANITQEFPHPNIGRALKAISRESDLVQNREAVSEIQRQRFECRYNNGRANDITNFDIISNGPRNAIWEPKVRARPGVWEWCSTEKV
jgi:hypothetical protein